MGEDDQVLQLALTLPTPPTATTTDDIRSRFYDGLIAKLGAPPTCLPDHGVHVYPDHRRATGPCQCASPPTEQAAR